jgi:hypothetical protein
MQGGEEAAGLTRSPTCTHAGPGKRRSQLWVLLRGAPTCSEAFPSPCQVRGMSSKNHDNQRQTLKDLFAGQQGHRACDQGRRGRGVPPLQGVRRGFESLNAHPNLHLNALTRPGG